MSDTKASPGPETSIGSDDYARLVRVLGDAEAEAVDASVGTMIHGMVIRDPRRVRKGLDALYYAVNRQEAPISPDVFDRMASMLLELEWSGDGPAVQGYANPRCPVCGAPGIWGYDAGDPVSAKKEEHRPRHVQGCKLAAILSELRRP